MRVIPLVGKNGKGKVAIVDDEDYDRCIRRRWYLSTNGYVKWSRNGKDTFTIAHLILGIQPCREIQPDHKDRNKLNNIRSNLRVVTQYENLLNSSHIKHPERLSGHKYIFWEKPSWRVVIPGHPRKSFRDIREAVAYKQQCLGAQQKMRVKYDVRGVETGERSILPAGVHVGTITGADITKPDGKDQRIELVVKVSDNGTDYTLYEYVNLESEGARWKLRELLEAVGITTGKKGEAGTLDTDKMLLNKKLGLKTFVRPADDARGFDAQARIKRMFTASDATTSDEDLDEPEAEADDGEASDYDDWTLADLRKEARGRGIKTAGLKTDGIIDLLIEDDEAQEEPEAEEEEEPEDEYDDMSLAQLRKAARERGIKTVRKTEADIIDLLREADAEAAGEEEVEAASSNGQPEDDYDEWDLEDLRTELKDRSLATKGGTKVLIARLRRDDAEGDNPF